MKILNIYTKSLLATCGMAIAATVSWQYHEAGEGEKYKCRTDWHLAAVDLERKNELAHAFQIYGYLSNDGFLYDPPPGMERPDSAIRRLDRRFVESIADTEEVLDRYRLRNGTYPARMNVLFGELSPQTLAFARTFKLCHPPSEGDGPLQCEDGRLAGSRDRKMTMLTGYRNYTVYSPKPPVDCSME